MQYFKNKTFTLDKTGKTLLSLFLEEAKNALGNVPGDYENKNDLCFIPTVFGSPRLLQCYFTEFLITVSQISDMLGYSSIHNFSRAFKKAVGMSPTAYAKSII